MRYSASFWEQYVDDFLNRYGFDHPYYNYTLYTDWSETNDSECKIVVTFTDGIDNHDFGIIKRKFKSEVDILDAEVNPTVHHIDSTDENELWSTIEFILPIDEKRNIVEASYGGAYDIGEWDFFTKEEIVEFADAVAEDVSAETGEIYEVYDVYINYDKRGQQTLVINLGNDEGEYIVSKRIDMRKIKVPTDLFKAYLNFFVDKFVKDIEYWN